MFNLFTKKEININKANEFWEWFINEESWIVTNINTKPLDVINAIDIKLRPIFPYFKKDIEFLLGCNNQKKEFFLYHFNNKQLKKDMNILKDIMPESLKDNWILILEK